MWSSKVISDAHYLFKLLLSHIVRSILQDEIELLAHAKLRQERFPWLLGLSSILYHSISVCGGRRWLPARELSDLVVCSVGGVRSAISHVLRLIVH